MFNKKIKNIIFVLLTIILVCSISVLNYFIDPYGLFKNVSKWDFNDVSIINIKIKLSKNKKNENLIIGGSDLCTAFSVLEWYPNNTYLLVIDGINYKNFYTLLKNYLRLHPETKNVFIALSYSSFYSNGLPVELKEFKDENLTRNELFRILFSTTVTNDSIAKICKILNKNSNEDLWPYYPSLTYQYLSKDDFSTETIKENYEYLNKIINIFEEKNINYTFFIPPYNILPLTLLYISKYHKNNIEDLKKYIVKRSKNPVYDMAFVNNYTINDLQNDNYSLYYDYMHPNQILGIKIYKMLFYKDALEKETYLILSKDNINKQIKYENDLIKDYIENNKTKVKKYKELSEKGNFDPYTDERFFNMENLPEEFKNDINYINERAEKQRQERN